MDISGGGKDPNRIELPGHLFPAYAPEPWYDSSTAYKFYSKLKTSSLYMMSFEYAEGVDNGWFRTTRVLYPRITDKLELERMYSRFIVNGGNKELTGTGMRGKGIADATKAAIDAFIAYK